MKIQEFIRDQLKKRLDATGCLVIYDSDGGYADCAAELAGRFYWGARFVFGATVLPSPSVIVAPRLAPACWGAFSTLLAHSARCMARSQGCPNAPRGMDMGMTQGICKETARSIA